MLNSKLFQVLISHSDESIVSLGVFEVPVLLIEDNVKSLPVL